ncbi:CoA transferase subunit A [Candidatus Acetothermia bacterium]|nr:CoA transferase subunit A [Candidatus Acetothermia bacterium]
MEKVMTAVDAVNRVKRGSTVMIGGFLGVGAPQQLLAVLAKQMINELTIICCAADYPHNGVGRLISAGLVKRAILSHSGTNPEIEARAAAGEIEVEFIPQGTLAERIRAAGMGLGGILVTAGLGTAIEKGKRTIEVDGNSFLLEKPLKADVALIKAARGDHAGNLVYHGAARNFNPLMATAADLVIAEVAELVPVGEINPDQVMTPAIFVDIIVQTTGIEGGIK